jgi:hypothetical protein
MLKLLLLTAALASCTPTAYYVANIYADNNGGLVTERCPIDNGRHGDKPDPDHCRYERVGPVPPEVQASLGGPPAPPAPPAPPPPPAQ